MVGKFGKSGETRRKTNLRQSGLVKKKSKKAKPDPKRLRRQKTWQSYK